MSVYLTTMLAALIGVLAGEGVLIAYKFWLLSRMRTEYLAKMNKQEAPAHARRGTG